MISRRLPDPASFRGAAAALLLMALLVSGCAHDLQQTQTPHTGNNQPQLTRTDGTAQPDKDDAPTPADHPADDLWQRIENGFELEPNTDRQAVRKWVQFYAAHHRHVLNAAKRAEPFLWHIVEKIDKRDMPMELALLPIVESGFDPAAASYSQATGVWQFMPATADRFGLRDDWWFDGRRDVLGSTGAALDYLEWLHARFDNWLLALSAYNAGEGRVDQALEEAERNGGPEDFWHLDLPRETGNYAPKLLALRELLTHAGQYALDWPSLPNAPLTEVVTLPGQVALSVAAEMMDMPVEDLQRLNPGVRRWATDPDGAHRLLVPTDRAERLRTALANTDTDDLVTWRRHRVVRGEALSTIAAHYGTRVSVLRQVNDLSGSLIRAGDMLLIPIGADATPAAANRPPARAPKSRNYTVARGDNLWDIARRNRVRVADLRHWNNLAPGSVLHPGQTLTIRGGNTGSVAFEYDVESGDSLWNIARAHEVSVAQLRRWNGLDKNTVLHPGQTLVLKGGERQRTVVYHVRPGDSLWSIAHRFQVHIAQLKDWNDLSSSTAIRPGQTLRIVLDATS